MLDPTREYIFGQQEEVAVLDPNKEYSFGSDPQELYRETPATLGESAISIGLEVIPAILGGITLGPKGAIGGSAAGNYFSQKYRIARGLQDEVGLGELGAATALRVLYLLVSLLM